MGEITIKGLAYEDIVSILTTNGYDVTVKAEAHNNATQNTYVINYEFHDYLSDLKGGNK